MELTYEQEIEKLNEMKINRLAKEALMKMDSEVGPSKGQLHLFSLMWALLLEMEDESDSLAMDVGMMYSEGLPMHMMKTMCENLESKAESVVYDLTESGLEAGMYAIQTATEYPWMFRTYSHPEQ